MSLLDTMPHECTIRRLGRVNDALGGTKTVPIVEQTEVKCWEQQASAAEIMDFERRGMKISRKVYFSTNPAVTERHEIIITKRQGTAVAEADQKPLTVVKYYEPDAGAGLGVVFKVMCDEWTPLR